MTEQERKAELYSKYERFKELRKLCEGRKPTSGEMAELEEISDWMSNNMTTSERGKLMLDGQNGEITFEPV